MQREGNTSHSRLSEEHITTGGGRNKRVQSLEATTGGYNHREGKARLILKEKKKMGQLYKQSARLMCLSLNGTFEAGLT